MDRDTPPRNDLEWAVKYLRTHAAVDARPAVQRAIEVLDEAGIFAAVDEQMDADKVPELLAEAAAISLVGATTPAPGAIKPHEALQVLRNTWQRWPKDTRPFPSRIRCTCDPVTEFDGYTIKTPWFHDPSCPLYAAPPE
jgi:hypothetical protein